VEFRSREKVAPGGPTPRAGRPPGPAGSGAGPKDAGPPALPHVARSLAEGVAADYLTVVLLGGTERPMASAMSVKTKVSTKGQVVLPKAIRDKRKWTAGTELTVEETPEGVLLRSAPLFAPTRLEDVAGMLRGRGRVNRVVSIEEMDEAVLAEARRRYLRSFDDRD
jgi:AbrB family looped-hinge helix DNA binding protein